MFEFRKFQSTGIDQVAQKVGRGVKHLIFQAPTGAGKTVLFCGLSQRFRARYPTTRILIGVHRRELMNQTVAAMQRVAGIKAGMIRADAKVIVQDINGYLVPHLGAQVVVAMVETLNNRLKKYDKPFGDIGLLIVDEVHRGEFTKLYKHFKDAIIVGFTATPIAANKKDPLKNHFEDIVTPVTIKELIDDGFLAKNITVGIKNGINRKKLKMRGGDFDEEEMALVYSAPKHVQNCVEAYEKYGQGEKTMIFNCNIAHSKLVNQAFIDAGFNSRHMDSEASDDERKEILEWFANTDDAVLQNVGLYTTGVDEPTIRTIMMNRSTMSLSLWLQVCGRGSRAIPGKDHFKILDLGDNVGTHCDWDFSHDWKDMFFHPEAYKKKKGLPPTKICKNKDCRNIIPISTKICPYCGYDHTKVEEYDTTSLNLEVLTQGIDIQELIKKNAAYKPYRVLHVLKHQIVQRFRFQYKHDSCNQAARDSLNERFQVLVKDWCKEQDKPYNMWHRDFGRKILMDELDRVYGTVQESYPQSAIK